MTIGIQPIPGHTDEQHRAVTTRDVSVSLAAGAGCGKTFVLTERYLAHFRPDDASGLSPDEISQLVAITFTDRAAREMRDRIRAKCHERLIEASEQHAAYWAELSRALDSARVSTIHAFCASLLRSRAVEAGVDPRFIVLEQAQSETLLAEAIDDEVRRRLGGRDEALFELAVRFPLDALREMVRRLVVQCSPEDFDVWLNVSADDQVAVWEGCADELAPRLGRELAASPAARTIARAVHDDPPTGDVMRQRCVALGDVIDRLLAGPDDRHALAACLTIIDESARVEKSGGAGQWSSRPAYDAFRTAATELRKTAGKLRTASDFNPQAAREAAVIGGQLLQLADGARREYGRRKNDLRAMDFDDLLARTRRLLVSEDHHELIARLSQHVTLLLVDEFQDTDARQVQLVEALCGAGVRDGKLFFVGDHKQSIYRFRGADPRVFRGLRQRTPQAGQQSLSLNFRSQPAILDFVNALFRDDLDDYEPLRPHRPQVGPVPSVEFLWAPADPASPRRETVDELRHREADWIARRMRALLDDGEEIVWDRRAADAGAPAARAAQPGDCAILLRALTNVEAYEAALRRYGIDYYLVGGHAFYAQQEIYDLLNLLRAVASPTDVVSLVGALRSGFFSLADETIYWLAQHPGGVADGLFADELPPAIDAAQRARAEFAANTIARLRACKDRLRISQLIELALSLTGYDAALLAEFLGERKLANLRKLEEQARSFEHGDFLSLSDFIAQLAEFVVRQPDEPLAATHSEDTNVVRLMSVHQAKGLEFPVVFVPDVNRKQNDPWAPAQFDVALGPLVPLRGAGESGASGYELWRHRERAEEAAEAIRLLYVATTRAADYLVLSSGCESIDKTVGPWSQLLARRFDLASGRLTARLATGQAAPSVRVTTVEPELGDVNSRRRTRPDLAKTLAAIQPATAQEVTTAARRVDAIGPDRNVRREFSFSRLFGTLQPEAEQLEDAWFLAQESGDPRALGTLVHAALAAIDLSAAGDCRGLVERLAEQHMPDAPDEFDAAVDMVRQFVASRRAAEIAAASRSHAEVEFLLGWPPDDTGSPKAVLRGVIDRLYQDQSGRWHLLDFKTNRLAGTNIAAQAASYEMQLLLYGLAAERILAVPPASLTLHFLRGGVEHQFAWDEAARNRVVELIDAALDAAAQSLETDS